MYHLKWQILWGQKATYVRNKGLDDDIRKQLIMKALQSMGEANKQDLMEVLEKALPEVLSDEQKSKKISNLLQAMKKDGDNCGNGNK